MWKTFKIWNKNLITTNSLKVESKKCFPRRDSDESDWLCKILCNLFSTKIWIILINNTWNLIVYLFCHTDIFKNYNFGLTNFQVNKSKESTFNRRLPYAHWGFLFAGKNVYLYVVYLYSQYYIAIKQYTLQTSSIQTRRIQYFDLDNMGKPYLPKSGYIRQRRKLRINIAACFR